MPILVAHRGFRMRIAEGRGCELMYLPPYPPDLNPIERTFSRSRPRCGGWGLGRTLGALAEVTGRALDAIIVQDTRGFFRHCGYRTPVRLLRRAL